MIVDREKLIAYLRIGVVLFGIASMILVFKEWKNSTALIWGSIAILVYSIAALLMAGRVDKSLHYYFCWIVDLFITILVVLCTRHFQNPFVPLFFLLILSFGMGRSLIKSLLVTIPVGLVYCFLYTYPVMGKLSPIIELSNRLFTIALFLIFAAGGALFVPKASTGDKEEETASEKEVIAATIMASTDKGTGISWQVPKNLSEAYIFLKKMSEENSKLRQDFQNERQMNNTIRSISHSIATLKDLGSLYEDIITKTRGEINSQSAFLMRLENNRLKVKYYDGSLGEITMKVLESSSLLSDAVATAKIIKLGVADAQIIERHIMGTHERIKTLLCVPLKTQYDHRPFGVIGLANYLMGDNFTDQHEEFLRLITVEAAVAIKNIEYLEDIEKKYDELILGLARAIEAKDNYTQEHVDRVRYYSEELATALGLPDEDVRIIKTAATLHDVGKIATPDHILRKETALNAEEWELMKDHTRRSVTILEGISSLEKEVLPLVLHHHERYDGKGYPDGLKGDYIPVGARVIAVADTFDAMTSDRPYRKGFPKDVALKKMKEECDGTQFDPVILDAFIRMMSKQLMKNKMHAIELSPGSLPSGQQVSQRQLSPEERERQPRIIDINYIRKGNDHNGDNQHRDRTP
jgi:putative nucleotidyltransferase with HDIG domain